MLLLFKVTSEEIPTVLLARREELVSKRLSFLPGMGPKATPALQSNQEKKRH